MRILGKNHLSRITEVEVNWWEEYESQTSSHSEFYRDIYLTDVNLYLVQPFKWKESSLIRRLFLTHLYTTGSWQRDWFPVYADKRTESFAWPSRPSTSHSLDFSGSVFYYSLLSHSLHDRDLLTLPPNARLLVSFSFIIPSTSCALLLDTLVVNFLVSSWSLFKHHLFWESFSDDNSSEMWLPHHPITVVSILFPFIYIYIFFL